MTESFKGAVRYSIHRDPKCSRWKVLSLSGPKARVFLQLLIPVVTLCVVNVNPDNDFLLINVSINYILGLDDGFILRW